MIDFFMNVKETPVQRSAPGWQISFLFCRVQQLEATEELAALKDFGKSGEDWTAAARKRIGDGALVCWPRGLRYF